VSRCCATDQVQPGGPRVTGEPVGSKKRRELAQLDPVALGNLAATGWRSKVADAVANPVSRAAPMEPDQVRAAVGAAFFLLSLYYVIQTSRRAARQIRG
jgi:hypothetical protein